MNEMLRWLHCAAFLVAGSSWALAGQAAQWSQFRGPGGQGISSAKGLPIRWSTETNLAWKTPLPGPGGSSPIVVTNRVYVTCYTGYAVPGANRGELAELKRHLLCLDRASGKVQWEKVVPAEQPEQEKVRDHGYASSTPAADTERVYVFFGKTGVIAFSHDGQELWRTNVGTATHGWGSAASPVFHGDLLLINAGVESESLIALHRHSGKEVWRAGGIRESWNTPILIEAEGKTELVLAIMGKVLGFNPTSGERLWSCETGIGWYMVPSLVSEKDMVYCIGGRTGGSLAVRAGGRGDVTQSRRVWTLTKGSNVSSPVLHEGHLYWLHENLGIVYCVEAKSGKVVYEERLERAGQFYASPVLGDGKLYCVGRGGTVFVVAAKPEFQLLARNDLRDRGSFDASPAIDVSRLLIRSDKFLYCIGAH